MHYDILIRNCQLLLCGQDWFFENGCLGICDNTIAYIGRESDLPTTHTCGREIDGTGLCAMSGLVNGHAHNGMTLFRGIADDLPLMTWLTEHIFPVEAEFVNEDMVYWCTKLACVELLLAGITCVADAYYHMDGACRAYDESGIRAVAAHGILDFPAPGVPDPQKKIEVVDQFMGRWQGHPRVTPAVFAHSPYTCSAETILGARALAQKHDGQFFIHLAETKDEAALLPVEGKSPVEYLESLHVLDEKVTLVHGVWLSSTDLDIVAKRGCKLVSCPRSNMQLGSGIAPVAEALRKNIKVGLGTDGPASNNRLDLFAEMDACAKLAKVRSLSPTHGKAGEVLHMATDMGASCLGLSDVGVLKEGFLADLILLDCQSLGLTPMYSPDLLVYGGVAGQVQTVIVDGEIVVEDRVMLSMDVNEVMDRVTLMAEEVRKQREGRRGN